MCACTHIHTQTHIDAPWPSPRRYKMCVIVSVNMYTYMCINIYICMYRSISVSVHIHRYHACMYDTCNMLSTAVHVRMLLPYIHTYIHTYTSPHTCNIMCC